MAAGRRVRALVAHFGFPGVMGCALAGAILMMNAGMNPLLAALAVQLPALSLIHI